MNKKLLAAAVAAGMVTVTTGALAAPTVEVHGRLQAEITDIDVDSTTHAKEGINVHDDYGQSRIIFIAKEKLGNGLTAVAKIGWKIQNPYDATESAGSDKSRTANELQGRELYVSLQSKQWGKVFIGSMTSPYKTTGGVKYDPFTATALEARSTANAINTKGGLARADLTGLGQSGHVPNAITWHSPKMNGFTVGLLYLPDESNGTGDVTSNRDGSWSGAVNYTNGPLHVGFAQSEDACNAVSGGSCQDATLTKLAGAYKFGNHKIYGQYEWDNDGASTAVAAGNDGEFFLLGYNLKSGNNTFVVQVGGFDGDVASDADVDFWSLGVIHKFSKNTRVFAGVRESDEDATGGNNDETAISAGLRMDF